MIQKYNKFIVAAVGGLISALEVYYEVLPEWARVLVLVATALGVYQVRNKVN